jgi:hypothetical protein
MFHGAGEEIRGNINSALDGLGDEIAGRPTATSSGDGVAARGATEIEAGREGLERMHAAREARKHAGAK